MFCTLIKFLLFFRNLKQGGCPPPPVTSVGGGAKQPPGLTFLSTVITLLMHKTCLYILGYITYIFNRRVDASKANLLKKGPVGTSHVVYL